MDLLNLMRHPEQGRRLTEILKVLVRYRLGDWLKDVPFQNLRDILSSSEARAMRERPLGERLRLALTDLGTTFIKMGQVLSTRADLVGPEIADELRKLQADTPADAPEVVKALIEEELGESPDALFASFEAEALASASIGQVHRAQLKDGQAVVIKIQHDAIQEKVRIDLELLLGLAQLLQEYVPDVRPYQPVATTREFRRTLLRELDFTCERRNMEQFTRNFAEDATIHIPVIHRSLCSRRILTMEFLEGIPGSKPEKIVESGVDLNEFTKTAANIFLNMILRDGFYHADPHPGNLMLLDGGVLGLLDCGMVGRIDGSTREWFEGLLLMLLQGDAEGLCDMLLQMGSPPDDIDRAGFRTDVSDLIVQYGSQSLDEFDLGGAMNELTDIVRRHQVLIPPPAALLIKTLVMLEGTSRLLSPTFSLAELLEPHKEQLIRDQMNPRRWLKHLHRSVRDIDRLVKQGPRNIAEILERLQSGKLKVKHEIEGLEVTVNRMVSGVLIASLFMGSSLLVTGAMASQSKGIFWFGLLGCLTAMSWGIQLLWMIRKKMK
ncbi:ABC1 kinase family protein [Planctomycetota bacterium]